MVDIVAAFQLLMPFRPLSQDTYIYLGAQWNNSGYISCLSTTHVFWTFEALYPKIHTYSWGHIEARLTPSRR